MTEFLIMTAMSIVVILCLALWTAHALGYL
jgi:hypothetical protein